MTLPPAYQPDPYVFVSYANADREAAYEQIVWLHKRGFNVWYDEGISSGTAWSHRLVAALSGCSHFLCLVTRRSVVSEPCLRELNLALERRRPVMAVFLEDVEVPPGLADPLAKRGIEPRTIEVVRSDDESYEERLLGWLGANPKRPRSVFLSHASANGSALEEQILPILEKLNFDYWYSRVSIQSAAEWERSIRVGLEQSEWFLLAMSREASQSEWVKDELFWAIENRPNRIIPVLLSECDPVDFHIRLGRLQIIDFTHDADAARASLETTLRGS